MSIYMNFLIEKYRPKQHTPQTFKDWQLSDDKTYFFKICLKTDIGCNCEQREQKSSLISNLLCIHMKDN